jgi:hypothetical protein
MHSQNFKQHTLRAPPKMIHRLSISLFLSLASALLVASSAAENLHPRAWYEAQFVNWMHEFGVEIEGGERT